MKQESISVRIYNFLLLTGAEMTTQEIAGGMGLEVRQIVSRLTELCDAGYILRSPNTEVNGYRKNLWRAAANVIVPANPKTGIYDALLAMLQTNNTLTIKDMVKATGFREVSIRGVLRSMIQQDQVFQAREGIALTAYSLNPDFQAPVALGPQKLPQAVKQPPAGAKTRRLPLGGFVTEKGNSHVYHISHTRHPATDTIGSKREAGIGSSLGGEFCLHK